MSIFGKKDKNDDLKGDTTKDNNGNVVEDKKQIEENEKDGIAVNQENKLSNNEKQDDNGVSNNVEPHDDRYLDFSLKVDNDVAEQIKNVDGKVDIRENAISKSILDILQEKGVLTQDQIRVAEIQASKTGCSIIDALIQMNFVSESVIHGIFEHNGENEKNKTNIVDMIPDMELIKKIPQNFAIEHKVIPISISSRNGKETVKIATNNPYDIVLLDQLSRLFENKDIDAVAYNEVELTRAVDKFYRGNVIGNFAEILTELELNVDDAQAIKGSEDDSPIVKFINALFYEAIRENASDIHVEPEELFIRIRFRIDGVLTNKTIVHKNYWSGICVRLKVLSGMNIAESKKPQDGGMTMTLQGREIDFRVSSLPTIYGENIVIRILDKTQGLVDLENLGFNKNNLKLINLAVKKPDGIVIVTGPTGSGKTTTLYSILSLINNIEDNIMTLEEPVEYRLPMIRQSEINHRAGFDFASGLRSLLRQDPDIIFLGEIRDQETAEIAIRASITGHQVYSTLHTNNAISAINRLIDMGVPSYMISGTLSAVVAQRLVRKLCANCKKAMSMDEQMKSSFGLPKDKSYTIYKACGCEKCNQTGYSGRIVVSEVLFIDDEINAVIAENPTIKSINEVAKKQGFITMQQDAIFKIIQGITSWDEVCRVIDMTRYIKLMG